MLDLASHVINKGSERDNSLTNAPNFIQQKEADAMLQMDHTSGGDNPTKTPTSG